MRAAVRPAILAALAALAGCSQFEPYPTYTQQPGEGVTDKGSRVAICYDGLVSSASDVRQAAQEECAPDTSATRVDTDYFLQYCPMLLPGRATFVCTPKPKK